jgi:hypothetical protein
MGQAADSARLVALLDLYKMDYSGYNLDFGNPDQKNSEKVKPLKFKMTIDSGWRVD